MASDWIYGKGLAIYKRNWVERLQNGESKELFKVRSWEVENEVWLEFGKWGCECKYYSSFQKICSHIMACMFFKAYQGNQKFLGDTK